MDRKLVQAPNNVIAGRPKAALLFWFFGDFRCGILLCIALLVIHNSGNAAPRSRNIIKPLATEKNVRNFDIEMATDEPLCSFTPPYE